MAETLASSLLATARTISTALSLVGWVWKVVGCGWGVEAPCWVLKEQPCGACGMRVCGVLLSVARDSRHRRLIKPGQVLVEVVGVSVGGWVVG